LGGGFSWSMRTQDNKGARIILGKNEGKWGSRDPRSVGLVQLARPLFMAPDLHHPQIGLSFNCKFMLLSS
jgi:hypothetical protein